MASIRKRGNSYLIVVSMGYGADGKRAKAAQKTVKPPEGLTAKQTEKWLQEQAVLFESGIKKGGVPLTPPTEKNITFADYTAHWLAEVAPHKLAKSTLVRSRHELARVLPHIGRVRLQDLRADRETLQTVLEILEQGDKKYEVYFKLIIATGIRRGKAFA